MNKSLLCLDGADVAALNLTHNPGCQSMSRQRDVGTHAHCEMNWMQVEAIM